MNRGFLNFLDIQIIQNDYLPKASGSNLVELALLKPQRLSAAASYAPK